MADDELVQLVDDGGRDAGVASKAVAHSPPGLTHRAVSVVAHDGAGRVLLQRRSSAKYHFGGLWSNTCCTHPRPGEDPVAAAARRSAEELGLVVGREELRYAGTFRYRATDSVSGLVEDEVDEVFVAGIDGTAVLAPEPSEVSQTRLISLKVLFRELAATPNSFTPWTQRVHELAAPELR